MELRKEESMKSPEPRTQERKRRFQIVKLEERIAPSSGAVNASSVSRTCSIAPVGFC